jgi:nucleoside recognition membrane protein YjiH
MTSHRHGQEHMDPLAGKPAPMWKFFVYSLLGAFVFFIPITIGGKTSIVLDHLVTAVQEHVPAVLPYFALALIVAGAVYPFVSGTWAEDEEYLVPSTGMHQDHPLGRQVANGSGRSCERSWSVKAGRVRR